MILRLGWPCKSISKSLTFKSDLLKQDINNINSSTKQIFLQTHAEIWHQKNLFYSCQIWSPELSWGDLGSSVNKKCCLSWMSLKKGNKNWWWTWIGTIYPSVTTRGLLKTKAFYLSLTVYIHQVTDILFLFWCRLDRYRFCAAEEYLSFHSQLYSFRHAVAMCQTHFPNKLNGKFASTWSLSLVGA